MRLTDLSPHWIVLRNGGDAVGITFRCPHCPPGERGESTYLGVFFSTPVDRDQTQTDEANWPQYMVEHPERKYWARSGEDFDTLSLTPSVDVSAHGHWHGFITNGAVT